MLHYNTSKLLQAAVSNNGKQETKAKQNLMQIQALQLHLAIFVEQCHCLAYCHIRRCLNYSFCEQLQSFLCLNIFHQLLNCFWILELCEDLPPLSLYEFLDERDFRPPRAAATARLLCFSIRFVSSASCSFRVSLSSSCKE